MPLLALLNNKLLWAVLALLLAFSSGWYLGSSLEEKELLAYKQEQSELVQKATQEQLGERIRESLVVSDIGKEYEEIVSNLPPIVVTERVRIKADCPVSSTGEGASTSKLDGQARVELSPEADRRIRELGNEAERDKIRLLKLQEYVDKVCLNKKGSS
jgi:hypothetical protein